ncbi:hypothetical protein PAPYR_1693 [Paratrimastix pyriformis]|uniref:Uncharacterized protein n=1 Tax=Paratrimastix pyriformis TaxID=342808 RepID=A0ABQ8UW60_9EUKA|nr:hypothetical protein PAPYR_1693 [Paratrimastix pyriformis]
MPVEILLMIVESSDYPLLAYLQFLGLCHTTRVAIRGSPRQLAFDDSTFGQCDEAVEANVVTPDALAAIVGPCVHLVKLSFPTHTPTFSMKRRRGKDASPTPVFSWVDEAFAGHSQLAALELLVDESLFSALSRILSHLTGLKDLNLTLNTGRSLGQPNPAVLLAAAPPGLRALRLRVLRRTSEGESIISNLTRIDFSKVFDTFACLERLELTSCPPAASLRPLAGQLTGLTLVGGDVDELTKVGFCRLADLNLTMVNPDPDDIAKLLAANQSTLQSLALDIELWDEVPFTRLIASLDGLPRLTSFEYHKLYGARPEEFAALSPGLVDRLERLVLNIDIAPPVTIASTRLRVLRLSSSLLRESSADDDSSLSDESSGGYSPRSDDMSSYDSLRSDDGPGDAIPPKKPVRTPDDAAARTHPHGGAMPHAGPALILDCPALVELALPRETSGPGRLVLRCPQLCSLEGLTDGVDLSRSAAMPALTRALQASPQAMQPIWLGQLLAGRPCPRLRELVICHNINTRAPPPPMLQQILGMGSLTRLEMGLQSLVGFPGQLPGQLRHLVATLSGRKSPNGLRVDAACLRTLILRGGPDLADLVIGCCPALVSLRLEMPRLRSVSLAPGAGPSLRSLVIAAGLNQFGDTCGNLPLDPTRLVALLEHPAAAHLRRVVLPEMHKVVPAATPFFWPRLAEALRRLPCLTDLELVRLPPSPNPLPLTCPRLRRLAIRQRARFPAPKKAIALVLDCPMLEELRVPCREFRATCSPGTQPRVIDNSE